MKVAYLGKIQLSDTDLPYLHEAQQLADVTYFMEVTPRFLKGPAYNIAQVHPRSGLFKAVGIYPEVGRLQGFIDLDKFYVLNTCGRLWFLKSFFTNMLLAWRLFCGGYDVIHLAWPPNVYEFALYALRRKMILTVHDPIPHTGHNSWIVRLRRSFAFRLIPKFILLNKAQRQEFLDTYHISLDRVVEGRMSSCTYLQTVAPALHLVPPQGTYILFSGRISPYKGLDYLLPAMKRVHEQCPDCRLVVAGGGKFHFDIAEYQSLDYVDIRNRFIPDDELVALIQNAAFMVCPYTDATQSGVVMSAFAFNKPVIATNVGGLPEMVCHEHYGLITNAKDVNALATDLTMLWENAELRQTLSDNIKRDYSSGQMSWREIATNLHTVYSTI